MLGRHARRFGAGSVGRTCRFDRCLLRRRPLTRQPLDLRVRRGRPGGRTRRGDRLKRPRQGGQRPFGRRGRDAARPREQTGQASAQRLDLAIQEVVDHPLNVANTLLEGARLLFQLGLPGLRPRDHHLNRGRGLRAEALNLGHRRGALLCKLRIEVRPPLVVLGLKRPGLAMQLLILDAQPHRKLGLLLGPTTGELFLFVLPTLLQVGNLFKEAGAIRLQATHVRVGVFLYVTTDVGGAAQRVRDLVADGALHAVVEFKPAPCPLVRDLQLLFRGVRATWGRVLQIGLRHRVRLFPPDANRQPGTLPCDPSRRVA